MMTEAVPLLLTAKQLQMCHRVVDRTQCYWIHLLEKDLSSDATSVDKQNDQLSGLDSQGHKTTHDTSDKADRVKSKGPESLMSACSLDGDPESESGLYLLRPSLLPQMEELLTKNVDFLNNAVKHEKNGGNKSVDGEGHEKDVACEDCSNLIFGICGLVFRNVPVKLWALPAYHELLLRGVFPTECEPIRLLGQRLERLLAPYGVCLTTERGDLHLTAQPMGLVGKVFATSASENARLVTITVALNLDLLAVLLFSIPDWRLLWSRDPRFVKQFAPCPSPGTPFHPFSLFPEHFTFDISFWTGPTWQEKQFYAAVREASHGTVEQVKLIDTFSHPDLSQTSYCYRLSYHSHTHALSHTQALHFHKQLESLLSSQLEVTIR